MWISIAFICVCVVGSILGIVIFALLVIARQSDRRMKALQEESKPKVQKE